MELVVVIVILGILATLAVLRMTGTINVTANNIDVASIRTLDSAISIAEVSGELD